MKFLTSVALGLVLSAASVLADPPTDAEELAKTAPHPAAASHPAPIAASPTPAASNSGPRAPTDLRPRLF